MDTMRGTSRMLREHEASPKRNVDCLRTQQQDYACMYVHTHMFDGGWCMQCNLVLHVQ